MGAGRALGGGVGGARRGSGRAAGMEGRAGSVGTAGLCLKSCKRFGVKILLKNARGENLWEKSGGVWEKNGGV